MAERLIIRNFAGLNLDIELGKINIFIGPQASGKSICIKCIEFFKGFAPEIIQRAIDGLDEKSFQERVKEQFNMYFDLYSLSKSFELTYYFNDAFVKIRGSKNKLYLTYSDYFHALFSQVKDIAKKSLTQNIVESLSFSEEIKSRFRSEVNNQLGDFSAGWVIFVPASRALYSLSDMNEKSYKDKFFNQFSNLYSVLRRIQWKHQFQKDYSLVNIFSSKILRGSLIEEDGEMYLEQNNGFKTRLSSSSSGQQEASPLVTVLQYLSWAKVKEGYSVFIEEPEAHLHPEAQGDLVNLLAAVYNLDTHARQLFITTHTPYLLSSFNNLIYAGQLASKLKKGDSAGRKKLYAAVPKELHLNLADFRVYGLENGKAVSLIDEESGLLMAHSLDSISDIIADQFGDLMALDPATQA